MGLLDSLFGGSKQSAKTTQEQSSLGVSVNRSNASSASGGTSSGFSRGVSGSSSSVFGADLFQQLYGGALGAVSALDPRLATERVNQLFTGGASIIDTLSGGGAGEAYLTDRLTGANDALSGQISALGDDLGRFFSETLNPAIRGSAVAGGTLGGGRQGIAEGLASEGVLKEFARGATALRSDDIARRDSAALGLLGSQNERAATAFAGLPALTQLGTGAANVAPFQALASVFGGPTVLTESFGQEVSQQESEQFATSLAEELGISYDEARALLNSTSSGRSTGGIIPGLASLIPGKG